MLPTLIYWLIDVRPETLSSRPTGWPFYCGKTVQSPQKRFRQHLHSVKAQPDTKLAQWLQACGSHVQIRIMEVVPTSGFWQARECSWIRTLRHINPDAANVAPGGQGGPPPTPETRARIAAVLRGEAPSRKVIDAAYRELRIENRAIRIHEEQEAFRIKLKFRDEKRVGEQARRDRNAKARAKRAAQKKTKTPRYKFPSAPDWVLKEQVQALRARKLRLKRKREIRARKALMS